MFICLFFKTQSPIPLSNFLTLEKARVRGGERTWGGAVLILAERDVGFTSRQSRASILIHPLNMLALMEGVEL